MRGANHNRSILVVDDDSDACDITVQALAHLGYPAHCVTKPTDALRLTAESPYSAVLMELVLPGLSGFDLFHAIRRGELNGATPLIALSAFQEYRHRALEVGFGAFVAKPIEVPKLRPVLQQLVPLSTGH